MILCGRGLSAESAAVALVTLWSCTTIMRENHRLWTLCDTDHPGRAHTTRSSREKRLAEARQGGGRARVVVSLFLLFMEENSQKETLVYRTSSHVTCWSSFNETHQAMCEHNTMNFHNGNRPRTEGAGKDFYDSIPSGNSTSCFFFFLFLFLSSYVCMFHMFVTKQSRKTCHQPASIDTTQREANENFALNLPS